MLRSENKTTQFEPSKKLLPRVMKALLEGNHINRTSLAQASNLNYATLCKYVMWLNQKSKVEFVMLEGKLTIKLTESGRELALKLTSIEY